MPCPAPSAQLWWWQLRGEQAPTLPRRLFILNSPSPESCPGHCDSTEILTQCVQHEGAQHCHDLGTGTQHPPDPRVGDLRDVNLDRDNTHFTELQISLSLTTPALCHLTDIPVTRGNPNCWGIALSGWVQLHLATGEKSLASTATSLPAPSVGEVFQCLRYWKEVPWCYPTPAFPPV